MNIDNEIVYENPHYYPIFNNSSYCFEVVCFDRTCNVAVHTGNSEFSKWLDDKDYDIQQKNQALVDDVYNFEFNYEMPNDITMTDIFSELLGDQMGFYGGSHDWIYNITEINSYEKIEVSNFK